MKRAYIPFNGSIDPSVQEPTVRIFIARKDSSGKIVEAKKTARVKALEKAANDLYAAAKKRKDADDGNR